MLDDGINTYQWSADGELTKRTPKNGGVSYDFASRFFGPGNAMRLDVVRGSDGGELKFFYDSFSRLVSHHWPLPRGGRDQLYYGGPDVVLERRFLHEWGNKWRFDRRCTYKCPDGRVGFREIVAPYDCLKHVK